MVSKKVQELSGRNKKQGGSQLHTTILSNKNIYGSTILA